MVGGVVMDARVVRPPLGALGGPHTTPPPATSAYVVPEERVVAGVMVLEGHGDGLRGEDEFYLSSQP